MEEWITRIINAEKVINELTEIGFRKSAITKFSKLMEDALTHCKEAKNLEKKKVR